MSKIREFIEENNIEFFEGIRNSTIVILIGYAQFLGLTKEQLEEELATEISADSFIKQEITRLWAYCKSRSYEDWWTTEEAIDEYKF
jgi:hypothetical protein